VTLTLRPTKTGLRFEYTDDDAETVVSIDKSDDETDTVRKLKRVIALVEGGEAAEAPPTGPYRQPKYPALEALPPQPTNGWQATYGPPALPDRLKGEVELIQPGEDT